MMDQGGHVKSRKEEKCELYSEFGTSGVLQLAGQRSRRHDDEAEGKEEDGKENKKFNTIETLMCLLEKI